ncbi:MAG: hypothetical protein WA021_05225 [Minisyncoccia bacterium]
MNIHQIGTVLELADKYYAHIGDKFGSGKQYGCLAVRGPATLRHPGMLVVPFGLIPGESGCYTYAPEKINRLAERPNHWSSFESRDPDNKRWGGAIRLPDANESIGFLSWSSLPELVDEAFMLGIALKAKLMEFARAEFIAARSTNTLFDPVLDFMQLNR